MRLRLSADPLVRSAWAFGVAWLVLFVLLQGKPTFTNASQPPGALPSQLAIQFISSVDDVDRILGQAPSPDREVMRIKLRIDYAFIAAYSGLLVTLGLLAARAGGWSKVVGMAAATCGVAAAVFDILENRATMEIVDASLEIVSPAMIDAVRRAATAKWILAAVSYLLLLAYWTRTSLRKT